MSSTNDSFRFGLETFLELPRGTSIHTSDGARDVRSITELLAGKRIAVLSHPAGVDRALNPGVDRIAASLPTGAAITALLGPQHGLRGEKQDNMIESEDSIDSRLGVPTFSLYGKTRRLTPAIADTFDLLLVDLQDVGVRVYTFLTTLAYILEDLQRWPEKEVWVLDRPNPTGRLVEGLTLEPGHESFVGAASIPMQHGLTLGEFARWYHAKKELTSRFAVVPMVGWTPRDPRAAWPRERVWVQPSPNIPGLYTTRSYPGTVMLEGTTLSEARGTTRPLSMLGHPDVAWDRVLDWVATNVRQQNDILGGCTLRPVTFQPTFHKHHGVPTPGFELVTEGSFWDPARFKPYRLVAAFLKAIREVHPTTVLWTDPPYEYEYERTPIDVITGGTRLRDWVDDASARWADLESMLKHDEDEWRAEIERWWIY